MHLPFQSSLPFKLGLFLTAFSFLCPIASAATVDLTAFDKDQPVSPASVTYQGQQLNIWQASNPKQNYTFKASESIVPVSGTLYLQVTYYDKGYGRLNVRYQNSTNQSVKPDKFTRIVLSDSQRFVTAYLRLADLPPDGSPAIQIGLDRNKDNVLIVAKASLQDTPFTDSHFQYILADAWNRPYDGPTVPGVDNTTLKGKVMVGYQGWFRTPNDPTDSGWIHWGDMTRGHFSTDMWPDITAYPPEALDKADDVKTMSGQPGYLFSSAWPEVVRTHFAWMRQNNIDGAFVQRFLGGMYSQNGKPEWVLSNVRAAAHQEGRIWAVEYDVSGAQDPKVLDELKKDWMWLVDHFGIKSDPTYAHEKGKLVVFIWGLPFPDRKFTPETSNSVIDFFKNDPVYGGNYVIGGIPGNWRKMDQTWLDHVKKYDGVLEWMSGSYAQDVADWKAAGIDYYPHVHPGFSWANLKHLPTGADEQFTPRKGGEYYEGLISNALQAGIDRLFVGMFDEYDEGTAIMPMSDDPPPTPSEPGSSVKYFPNPKMQEQAPIINKPMVEQTFDQLPPAKNIPTTNYLMRWEGQMIAPSDGDYQVGIQGVPGDTANLWIDGKQVLKETIAAGDEKMVTVPMKSGQMVIYKIDYLHGTAPGKMEMDWQSPTLARQEVPASALVDAWGRFLTNEGHPSDLYLKITLEAKAKINGPHS